MENRKCNIQDLEICKESYNNERVIKALQSSYKMQATYKQNQANLNQKK